MDKIRFDKIKAGLEGYDVVPGTPNSDVDWLVDVVEDFLAERAYLAGRVHGLNTQLGKAQRRIEQLSREKAHLNAELARKRRSN